MSNSPYLAGSKTHSALKENSSQHQQAHQVSLSVVRHSAALLPSPDLRRHTWAVSRQDGGMFGSAYQSEPAYVRRRSLEELLVLIAMCVCVCVCVLTWQL